MTDGEKIRTVRKALRLTQEAFGSPLGISKGHISDVEKGKKNLSQAAADLLKIRFAVKPEWWETGEGVIFEAAEKEKAEMSPDDQENLSLILKLSPRKKRELKT